MKPVGLRSGERDSKTEEEIRTYLCAHPDFFERNEELLEFLAVPHLSGSAVSLIERQLSVYREKNEKLQTEFDHLVDIARDNEQLFQKMHKLTLVLMETVDLETMITRLKAILHDQFKADFVAIKLFHDPDTFQTSGIFVAKRDQRLENFRKIVESRRPECGHPLADQVEFLFGDQAERVRSLAIIPFFAGEAIGLLAFGSLDEQRFSPGMGHLFLSRIGEMLGVRLGSMFVNPRGEAACLPD
ncbi:MAG: DUF484 family protein [Methylococcales bacterium]